MPICSLSKAKACDKKEKAQWYHRNIRNSEVSVPASSSGTDKPEPHA